MERSFAELELREQDDDEEETVSGGDGGGDPLGWTG